MGSKEQIRATPLVLTDKQLEALRALEREPRGVVEAVSDRLKISDHAARGRLRKLEKLGLAESDLGCEARRHAGTRNFCIWELSEAGEEYLEVLDREDEDSGLDDMTGMLDRAGIMFEETTVEKDGRPAYKVVTVQGVGKSGALGALVDIQFDLNGKLTAFFIEE